MPDYQTSLSFLYGLQRFGIKAGLKTISRLLNFLGNPHHQYPVIHIAGTNGKGSTSAMIAAILTASGYKTGLYTSPHLIQFNERIRIDGKKISDDDVARYTQVLKNEIKKHKATFFEATTAIAFQYFADQKIDVAVIETGLGGRLDATNVVHPLVSVITNIGLEHTEYLGRTIERIAYEKGGIIKPDVPCITGSMDRKVIAVLQRIVRARHSKLIVADQESSVNIRSNTLDGLNVNVRTNVRRYDHTVPLAGEYQAKNLQLAILAIERLQKAKQFSNITEKTISLGLSSVNNFSGIRCRMEVISHQPVIIADVAHNPDGIRTLVSALRKLITGKAVVVFGVMKDKEYLSMIQELLPITRVAVAVTPTTGRALESLSIVHHMHEKGMKAINGKTVKNGINLALKERRESEPIIVTGSHYLLGEVLQFLKIST